MRTGGGSPAAFLSDDIKCILVGGIEQVGGSGGGVTDKSNRMNAGAQRRGRVSGPLTRLAIEIEQGTESVWLAPDDGQHQRQAEGGRADHGLGRPSDADPDR